MSTLRSICNCTLRVIVLLELELQCKLKVQSLASVVYVCEHCITSLETICKILVIVTSPKYQYGEKKTSLISKLF